MWTWHFYGRIKLFYPAVSSRKSIVWFSCNLFLKGEKMTGKNTFSSTLFRSIKTDCVQTKKCPSGQPLSYICQLKWDWGAGFSTASCDNYNITIDKSNKNLSPAWPVLFTFYAVAMSETRDKNVFQSVYHAVQSVGLILLNYKEHQWTHCLCCAVVVHSEGCCGGTFCGFISSECLSAKPG